MVKFFKTMSQGLLNALLGGDASDDYNLGTVPRPLGLKRKFNNFLEDALPTSTTLIARHVRHALCPYSEPPAPLPYGGTGGAEQLLLCTGSFTFVQPANYAGYFAFAPCYASDTPDTVLCTDSSYAFSSIQTGSTPPAGVLGFQLSGSNFVASQLNDPTVAGSGASGGIKAKWTQCFFRVRCIDNVVDRGGDGFIGQVAQQGGSDVNGITQQTFNSLVQQRLCKKLLVNGEWNDWHCTTFEQDLRYSNEQEVFPQSCIGIDTTTFNDRMDTCYPFFCYLYPNGKEHNWEAEVYFTFQADGNTGVALGSATPQVQPNIQDIPHVPEAANINAAIAYARSKIPAGNSKHTSIGHHVSNFFKSVGHDLEHGLNDALTGAAAAGAAALFM